jgi:putative hydrolase of the HAD superfamily
MWFNHSMKPGSFTHILFDWGDTLMVNDPAQTAPMAEWPAVRSVPGAEQALRQLKAAGKVICLATSADVSDEAQIRAALARVGLEQSIDQVFCFKNTGLPKGEAFYRKLLRALGISPAQALMVGDSFEKDVLAANAAGMAAIWFNERSPEQRTGALHLTVHSMDELRAWFSTAT